MISLTAHAQTLELSLMGGGIASYHPHGSRITIRDAKILAPWPNRIADARYVFQGHTFQLPANEHANAIHGFVRELSWSVVACDLSHAELATELAPSAGYPFTLGFRAVYDLTPHGLEVAVHATNRGERSCPYGIGMHPYFFFDELPVDALSLLAPASRWIENDTRCLPIATRDVAGTPFDFRAATVIGTRILDNALTGFAAERTCVVSGGGDSIALHFTSDFAQIYTSDTVPAHRQSLAVEPMSCAANAFNSGDGLVVLARGETHAFTWQVRRTPSP